MATVTFTIPDNIFHLSDTIEKAAIGAVNTTVDAVNTDFQSSVQHFNHKPVFVKERAHVQGDAVVGSVYTDDENYARLNNGTESHFVGQSGGLMRFYGVPKRMYHKGIMVYQPKSIPGSISSRPGGNLTNYRAVVRGPWRVKGIDARNYDQLIADKNQPVLEAAFNRAIQQVVK